MPPHDIHDAVEGSSIPEPAFTVVSPDVTYTDEAILSRYRYQNTLVEANRGQMVVKPTETLYEFKTERAVPRVGLLLVGWGGNNGSTVSAAIAANRLKLQWRTKSGVQQANYFGSITQASTLRIGTDANGNDIFVPFSSILPMVHPNDLVIGGWDINSANIAEAMARAEVLEWDLQRQLIPELSQMKPMPSIYYPDFIAANQEERADNVIGGTKQEQMEHIRNDIRWVKHVVARRQHEY